MARTRSMAMDTALLLVEGGLPVTEAAIETGLTYQGIYKAMRSRKPHRWTITFRKSTGQTSTLCVTATSARSAVHTFQLAHKHTITKVERIDHEAR